MRYAFAFIAGAAVAGVLVSSALRTSRPTYVAPACPPELTFGPAYVTPPRTPPEWWL